MDKIVMETNLSGLKLFSRGKVRDIWELSPNELLMVATDRLSAFDAVVGAIPGKGKILTRMSEFWFKFLRILIKTHFVSDVADVDFKEEKRIMLASGGEMPHFALNCIMQKYGERYDLVGRSMIIKKAKLLIPIECVVRGYLAGSAWEEYRNARQVCGIRLPLNLREADKLSEPIFTPATKAEQGQHDVNLTFEQMIVALTKMRKWRSASVNEATEIANYLKKISVKLYECAAKHALSRGIIIADTKFEFGVLNGEIMLIDEALTPDSSRFWSVADWRPGRPQKSFDKQIVRDWLVHEAQWDKKSEPPELPDSIIALTAEKYREAATKLIPSYMDQTRCPSCCPFEI